jgi:hypothetical protein
VRGCWLFHRYGRWEDLGEVRLTWDGVPAGRGMEQGRRCERCGKLQLRVEEPYA